MNHAALPEGPTGKTILAEDILYPYSVVATKEQGRVVPFTTSKEGRSRENAHQADLPLFDDYRIKAKNFDTL